MPNFDRSVAQVIDEMYADICRSSGEVVEFPGLRVQPTAYAVSAVPEGGVDYDVFEIRVEYQGNSLWRVRHRGKSLGVDGEWGYRPADEDDRDEWMSRHRFDLPAALRLARDAAPHITVNGYTVQDVLAGSPVPTGRRRRDG